VAPPAPPAKKRCLKKQVSDSSSEQEEKTLMEIVKQCTQAATAGRIYSTDKANAHTLHFWANAVASSLKQYSSGLHEMAFTAVKENFGRLLTKLLLSSDCYEHLSHFEELYKTLEEKGVILSTLAAPLRKLMTYNIETEATLGVEDMDLNAQRRLFTSNLWRQFEKRRAVFLLRKAKDEEHGEERDRLLKLWDAVPKESMCSSTKADLEMARSLFLSTLPLPTRVTYALGDASRMTFAQGWKADFDFNALMFFRHIAKLFRRVVLRFFYSHLQFHFDPRSAGVGDESDHESHCGVWGVLGRLH